MVRASELNNDNRLFKDDYNLSALVEVKPWKDSFSMLVTPRFKSIYENGYEMFSTRVAKNFMKKSDLFVDVGANYGYYSLLAAHTNDQAHIIAIEPVEENFLVLLKNTELNNIPEKQIDCIKAAASSTAGTIKLYKSEASDNSSIIPHPNSETLQQIEVPAVTLDQLLCDVDVNESVFIKIDTDGNELDVLQGFKETIKRVTDVTLLIEINPKLFKLTNTSYVDIANFLEKNDFMVYAVDDNAFRYYPLDNPENILMMLGLFEKAYFNILCVRKEKALSVAFFSHSAELGGAERSLLDLITGLAEMCVLCTAILPYDGSLAHALCEAGCAVYTLPQGLNQTISWWWAETGRYSDCMGITKLPSSINAIKDTLLPEFTKIMPDVIFSQTIVSPWGAFIAEKLGIPHAISAREYGMLDHKLKFMFDFKESMDALYNTSDTVFCISHDVKDTLFGEDIDDKVDIIYSNIQINADILLAPINPELNIMDDPNAIKVGIFGSIVESKGQKDFVKACIELLKRGTEITCYIVGHTDQAYFEEIMGIINNSDHKTSFILPGFIDNPYPLMNLMNIIVSCSEREALGRTLLEAVLLDKPIIYSNSGGPTEIFTDGINGLAYEHGNYLELADKIEYTIANEAETKTRIIKASKHINFLLTSQNYTGKVYSKLSLLKSNGRNNPSRCVIDLVDKYNFSSLSSRMFCPKFYFTDIDAQFTEINLLYIDTITYGFFNILCDLPDDGFQSIRFDPVEGELIELTIYRTEFVGYNEGCKVEIIECLSNGVKLSNNSWEFNNYDPQVIFELNRKVRQIRIIGELRRVYPQKTISFLNQEIQKKNQEIEDIVNSKSWRLTAPLRKIFNWFRG